MDAAALCNAQSSSDSEEAGVGMERALDLRADAEHTHEVYQLLLVLLQAMGPICVLRG
jgi:hypothetical protein